MEAGRKSVGVVDGTKCSRVDALFVVGQLSQHVKLENADG
jgi:hypothetical protein